MRLRKLLAALLALVTAGAILAVPATPAYADECYTWPRTLRSGMAGEDVRQLQIRVAGWTSGQQVVLPDGKFGPLTENAVKRFQTGYGLGSDGVAGPQTFGKIYELQDADCTPAHFSFTEMDDDCGDGYDGGRVPAAKAKDNALRVMWKLEALRKKLGDRPLTVTSGFRHTPGCGDNNNSQHHYGNAADLDSSTASLCTIALAARDAGFSGIFGPGYPGHDDHTHVDSRFENDDDGINPAVVWRAPSCGI
ncbi:D-Ala-D-Ala carboxypeptidase family metallohydrolase [Kribbella sp. NPDC056345]|uniref:D-Ala-D-Ala carboxypeptidase family metallohydrolase n=1 Tax=Kribbella sp. NPDC056345 TaxID=3345789 RepID=UPI0035D574E6